MNESRLSSRSPLRFRVRNGVRERCCSKCNTWRSFTIEHFSICRGNLEARCRICKRAGMLEHSHGRIPLGPELADYPVVVRSEGVPPRLPGLAEIVMGAGT